MLPSTATLATYGGEMADALPVEDASTDLAAAQWNQLANDVAMGTRVGPRAWVEFTGATYTSGTQALTVTAHGAMWGSSDAVKPVVEQTAAGVIRVTWAATQTDELGATKTLALARIVSVTFSGATPYLWTRDAVTANTASILVFDIAGAPNAADGATISVEVQ